MLKDLLAAYPDEAARSQAAWRLSMAAEGMDEASVHTIDAWCQRMLREHAFDSGCLFDEALEPDAEALLTEAAQDYWRQHCYSLSGDELAEVLKVWADVQALTRDVGRLHEQDLPEGAGQGSLAECLRESLQQRRQRLDELKAGWAQRAQAMRGLVGWADGAGSVRLGIAHRSNRPTTQKWLANLAAWADDTQADVPELTDAARHRLNPEGLLEARKASAPGIELPEDFAAFAQLLDDLRQLPDVRTPVRLHGAARVGQRLAHLKRQAAPLALPTCCIAWMRPCQARMARPCVSVCWPQYPVAMLDEFQDTSPLQYRIFDQIYRTADHDRHSALLLIGDPKQSIYGFRGADIHSYMAARRATAGRHYVLDTNYRSTQALVGAVNAWFQQAEERDGPGGLPVR
jgi:exodeoxyribonuclease V beta subunit